MSKPKAVPITLDGVQRFMRWDLNAIATIEELTGENAMEGVSISATNVRAIVYAALAANDEARDQDPQLSLRQVGALLNTDNLESVVTAVQALIKSNSPEAKPADPTPAVEMPQTPTVSRSTGPMESDASISDSVSVSSGA